MKTEDRRWGDWRLEMGRWGDGEMGRLEIGDWDLEFRIQRSFGHPQFFGGVDLGEELVGGDFL